MISVSPCNCYYRIDNLLFKVLFAFIFYLAGLGKCDDSLVTALPIKSFNSSSEYGRGYAAAFAKLNRVQGMAV